MAGNVKILVADRNALVVEAVEDLFVELGGGTTVLTATSLAEALLVAQHEQPDLVVIDAWIGSAGAEAAVRQVLECAPAAAVFVMSSGCDREVERRVVRAGARGCRDKEELPASAPSILDTVRSKL